VRLPNDRLRAARLDRPSPSGSGRRLSRQELADMVNAELAHIEGRYGALDATYIGKLERGEHRWPQERYRQALRAVLGAQADAELGFFVIRKQTGKPPPQIRPAFWPQFPGVESGSGSAFGGRKGLAVGDRDVQTGTR